MPSNGIWLTRDSIVVKNALILEATRIIVIYLGGSSSVFNNVFCDAIFKLSASSIIYTFLSPAAGTT